MLGSLSCIQWPRDQLTKFCCVGGAGETSCSPFTYRQFQFNLNQGPALKPVCGGSPYENVVAGAHWNEVLSNLFYASING